MLNTLSNRIVNSFTHCYFFVKSSRKSIIFKYIKVYTCNIRTDINEPLLTLNTVCKVSNMPEHIHDFISKNRTHFCKDDNTLVGHERSPF